MYKLYISINPTTLTREDIEYRIGFFVMLIKKSINLITLHLWTYLALLVTDVNIVAHHLCKPKHHLIPQLVMSNKVF